jgi:DNA-binding transcriptional regulator YhcF (GntR family)
VIPFRVQFRTGISLFEQIVYAAKKAMVSGQMRPGDPFPSVRALSRELKINPNTAHKIVAYLVSEGLLETRPGIGTVVAARNARNCSATRSRNWWLRRSGWASAAKRCSPPSPNTGSV